MSAGESSAWVSKARLEQPRVVVAAHKSAGRTVVRSPSIRAPGAVPVPEPAAAGPAPSTVPAGPVRPRETASDGHHRALAAHRQAAPQ
ncbi:hypothetical protein [Streptomyces sp. NBC_01429]|uniref:hypothetical protein n=1 Tax=Streptomyces sp. NBC_01429 TaxID=2903862 RepID=UPI002E2DC9EC|nr:hypothetical protein [Streptomyces sp. NBC_01429]